MPNFRQMTPVNTKSFTWNKKDRSLTTCSSDLGPLRDGLWWLSPIYTDAEDVGIMLQSHKTGKQIKFLLAGTETREGDLLSWRFIPLNPKESPINTVVIWND